MDKKCQNCKWFNHGKCNSKDFQNAISGGSVAEDEFTYLTEEGYLQEYLLENDDKAYELADMVLEKLKELEYIKKNKKVINSFKEVDEYESFIQNYSEIMDSAICNFIIPKLRKINIQYEVDSHFGCIYWE